MTQQIVKEMYVDHSLCHDCILIQSTLTKNVFYAAFFTQMHILIKRIISPLNTEYTSDYVYVSPKYSTILNMVSSSASSNDKSLKRKRVLEEKSGMIPVRQYFHSKNLVPMLPHEWDKDSDDESDTSTWIQTIRDEVNLDCYTFYI
jgi:hypothetical protein